MDGSEASVGLNGDYFAYGNYLVGGASCMGKRARRGGRSELAREIRAGVRDSLCQAARDQPGRPVPTQGPEARRERARPSVAPGYQSPASAAAAADAEFPEDWPRAESPEPPRRRCPAKVQTAAPPAADADIAAAPWRRAAGPQAKRALVSAAAPQPEGRAAKDPPAAEAAAGEDRGAPSRGTKLIVLRERNKDRKDPNTEQSDLVLTARDECDAPEERRQCSPGDGDSDSEPSGQRATGHDVSLSSEGELSTSTPRESRSRSRSPDTPEVYREFDRDDREFDREFERLEICSLEIGQDGGAGSSSGGAAKGHGRTSGSSRAGARPAARGRGRGRPPWVRPWKAGRGTR